MNTKCVVSFAKSFFFFGLPHISYEERRYYDKFYLFSMANLWRKWKSYSEISFDNDYHFFFSLKSTQQKFKELLSEHCQLHCRKKNAAELSWWWLNQTIIIPCIKANDRRQFHTRAHFELCRLKNVFMICSRVLVYSNKKSEAIANKS